METIVAAEQIGVLSDCHCVFPLLLDLLRRSLPQGADGSRPLSYSSDVREEVQVHDPRPSWRAHQSLG